MPVDSGRYTPETLSRRRKLAEALMSNSMQPRPIGSHLEGLSQLANTAVGALAMRQADREEDEYRKRIDSTTQKIARALMGGRDPRNAEYTDPLMVQTTAEMFPDRDEAMRLAMSPEGAAALQQNPVLAQMVSSQFKPLELDSVDLGDRVAFVDASGQVVREVPKGATPGAGGSQAAMLQEYNLYRQQMEAAGKQPLDLLGYIQSRTPNTGTPSFSSIPLGDGTYGVLNQRTGEIIPTGQKAPPKETQKPPTEGERVSANYLARMEAAERLLGDYMPSMSDYLAAQQLMSGGAVRSGLANQVLSPEGQRYYQAAADWVRAKLRKESGAVIAPEEMAQEIRTYFPVPGDTAATIEQKRRARLQAQEGMRQMAGTAVPRMEEMVIHPRGQEPAVDDPLGIL